MSNLSIKRQIYVSAPYRTLLTKVSKELNDLEFLIKRSATRAYWNVGKYIDKYSLSHKERAGYGKTVLEDLSRDTGRSVSSLQRALRFYRMYRIQAVPPELTWEHYRSLITVDDVRERKQLESRAVKAGWNSTKLRQYLQAKRRSKRTVDVTPLKFTPGRLNTYRVVKANQSLKQSARPPHGGLALDLGFRAQTAVPPGAPWKEGDTVAGGRKVTASAGELFTYLARVERVIDGDTVVVSFGFGKDFSLSQKLRLAGIDCAEINTAEGKAAKRFVEARLKPGAVVLVKTIKDTTDRYDRYLAEVFLGEEQTAENFLNQMLLDEGLAVRYV